MFGNSGSYVSYGATGGEFTATGCTVTVADVELACKSVPGLGTDFYFKISLTGQTGPSLFVAGSGYALPVIASVSMPADVPTTGILSNPLVITGENLGRLTDVVSVSSV